MEDETPESETTEEVEIELSIDDDTSATAKVAAALFTGAAVIGAYTLGKKAFIAGRGWFTTMKESRNKETSTPESPTPESETEEK